MPFVDPDITRAEEARFRARQRLSRIDASLVNQDRTLTEEGIETSATTNKVRLANARLERTFPGLSEDENTTTGTYEPSVRNYGLGQKITQLSLGDLLDQDQYMSSINVSRLQENDSTITDDDVNNIRTERRRNTSQNDRVETGTGEWYQSLTPELQGHYPFIQNPLTPNTRSQRNSVLDLDPDWNGGKEPQREGPWSQYGGEYEGVTYETGMEIDVRNVKNWATQHLAEVAKTIPAGPITTEALETTYALNTESKWSKRYNALLKDLDNDIELTAGTHSFKKLDENDYKAHKEKIEYEWKLTNSTGLRRGKIIAGFERSTLPQRSRRPDNSSEPLATLMEINRRARSTAIYNPSRARSTRGPRTNIPTAAELMVQGRNARAGSRGNTFRGVGERGEYNGIHNVDGISGANFTVYSYNTPIAYRYDALNTSQGDDGSELPEEHKWFVKNHRMSVTTSRHQSAIRRALRNSGLESSEQLAQAGLYTAYETDRNYPELRLPRRFYTTNTDSLTFENADSARERGQQLYDEHRQNYLLPERQRRQEARLNRRVRRPTRQQSENSGQISLPLGEDNG